MQPPIFLPKLVTCLRGYTRRQCAQDLVAGLTVGMVALPLALAFGIASIPESAIPEHLRAVGLSPPVMGLFTAVVAGLIISLLGGTRVAIGGPTGAFVVIVYAIAAEHGYSGLVIATIMAGVILVGLGLSRLGGMIKYIPYPVTTGFTSGIAVIIFAGQIKDLLGLRAHTGPTPDAVPPDFIHKVHWYATHAGTIDGATAILGLSSCATIFLWPRFVTKRVPGPIVVMLLATAIAQAFHLPVETIRDRFGDIPSALPSLHMPVIDWSQAPKLVGPAFTIAILAAIESLLCAVVADGMLGTRHRSNTELIAQGLANIASPLFGGIPATGAIARTATNVQSGGRTPISGIVHALTLLVVMVAVGRYASLIPMAVLAAVLVVVAYNMSEMRRFRWLLSGPRSDAAVLLTTFLLTVLTDLTIAVQVGMVLAAMLFIKRMADVTNVSALRSDMADTPNGDRLPAQRPTPPGVEVYDVNGPFFFGAAYKLRDTLDAVGRPPKVLILEMEDVTAMDATGLHALDDLRRKCAHEKTTVLLAGVHAQPLVAMTRSGLLDRFGVDALPGSLNEALEKADAIVHGRETAPTQASPATIMGH